MWRRESAQRVGTTESCVKEARGATMGQAERYRSQTDRSGEVDRLKRLEVQAFPVNSEKGE